MDQLYDPAGAQTALGRGMDVSNYVFTAVFAAELCVNLFAHWLRPFLGSGWSLLDAAVVLLSLVALGPVSIPVTVVRLLRVFRVVRLFGRLRALRKMVSALSASVVPLANAFFILFIIASLCAGGRGRGALSSVV